MFLPGALELWKRQRHGARVQVQAITYISEKFEAYHLFGDMLNGESPSLTEICRDCKEYCTPDVSIDTLRRWWNIYLEWGELPYKVAERKKAMKGKYKGVRKNELLDDNDVLVLKDIVDNNPNHYLDELAFLFGIKSGKFVHYSTICRTLKEKLSYSLQVLSTIAKRQCEDEETRFLEALDMLLQSCPDRLLMVDETHKDRNAARRRRGWCRRGNGDAAVVREWFDNVARYTLLAAADINGFIPSACHTVMRDEISEEGAAGTVDSDYFLHWVKTYLCPVLGNYERGEPRSVVLMDNASTHMSDEVEDAITATGAVLIYGPPYSPHLNPIELYFGMYKKYLKKNDKRMESEWYSVHSEALTIVDHDEGINFF